MLRPSKPHTLNFKLTTDKRKKIDPGDDNVAAQNARRFLPDSKVGAEPLENLRGKKCDLAFVIFSMIKVAVPEQTLARDTLDSFPAARVRDDGVCHYRHVDADCFSGGYKMDPR